MTAILYDETSYALGMAQLEQRLQIGRGRGVAVVNAPSASGLRLLPVSRANPDEADTVIAFATRRRDLARVKSAYYAARSGRLGWLVFPTAGRPGTDLRWDWLVAALRQYGVQPAQEVSIDGAWSAVLLQQLHSGYAEADLVGFPTHHTAVAEGFEPPDGFSRLSLSRRVH